MTSSGPGARERLARAGLDLPIHRVPTASYLAGRRHGDVLYCAGVTSAAGGGPVAAGGAIDAARDAARDAALRQLASIEHELGSLDRVADVLRLTGYVACTAGFTHCPAVLDAASEVFITAFGEKGRHARSAIGVAALPLDATVEIETIIALQAP